jgi:hypothetical protein
MGVDNLAPYLKLGRRLLPLADQIVGVFHAP